MSNTSGTSSVLDTARSAAAEAGLDPAKLAQDVGAKLKDVAESQKHAGAEKVLGVARAIRNAAGNIEQESPEMARYVRSAASTIENFTRDFDDRSVDDLGQAVVDMARRSPGLFFAGSMIAGFALFRFLNAAQGGSHAMGRQNWSSRRGSSMEGGAHRSLGAQRGSGQGGYGSASAGGYDMGDSSSGASGSTPGARSSASTSTSTSPVSGSGAGGSYGGMTPSSSDAVSAAKGAAAVSSPAGASGSTGSSSPGGYGGGGQGASKQASTPSSGSSQGRGQS